MYKVAKEHRKQRANSNCKTRKASQGSDWKDEESICKLKKGKIPAVEALHTKTRGVKELSAL